MRIFAWIYLVLYALDAVFSVLAALFRNLEQISSSISNIAILLTLVVFVLALVRALVPRGLFLILSGYYLLTMALGVAFGLYVFAELGRKRGAELLQSPAPIAAFEKQFSWFASAHWVMLVGSLFLAAYGLVAYAAWSRRGGETGARV